MKKGLFFKSAIVAFMAFVFQIHAAPFMNGSFESDPNNPLNGWTAIDIDWVHDPSTWAASDGVYSIDLNAFGPGSIEQTFDTVIGQTYDISFDLSGNPGDPRNLKTLDVLIDNVIQIQPSYDTALKGNTGLDMKYETINFSFVAANTSTSLKFESTTFYGTGFPNDAQGPVIDNVQVSSAVPEPSTYALMALGLLGLGVYHRKRKK